MHFFFQLRQLKTCDQTSSARMCENVTAEAPVPSCVSIKICAEILDLLSRASGVHAKAQTRLKLKAGTLTPQHVFPFKFNVLEWSQHNKKKDNIIVPIHPDCPALR